MRSGTFLCVLLVIFLLTLPAVAQTTAGDFFVSPAGNDQWTGRLAAPNAAGTDGPFATVARAAQAVRELRKAQPDRDRPVMILLRGGSYFLAQPLELTPDDSGSEKSPTVFAAYGDEKPVLSGGVRLSGWKVADGRWTLVMPEVQKGEWNFIQLFVDGQRRQRPRMPESGYFTIAEKIDPAQGVKGYDRFKFNAQDIRPDFANLNDVEVLAMQIWTMARLRIAAVDPAQRVVSFTGTTSHRDYWSALQKNHRYLLENVKEALSKPGQWYLERKTGLLTYIPMPGEAPDRTEVIAPRTESLLRLAGDLKGRKWVSHVVFRGLGFAHGNWATPREGYSFAQAEAVLSGAIVARGARDVSFEKCSISQTGAWALDVAEACKRIRIEGCDITDIGAGGIKLGIMGVEKDEELLTSHNVVRDNTFAHGGRLHPAAHGIWVGQSPHNVIEHNEIADFYYTGISLGWTWGYGPAQAHHNTVAYNHIHTIGQGVLSDMGGIYTLGLHEGTVLHHNLIHDVHAWDYGGWGIYFDEGTTRITAENNVVHRVKTGGFHQHYGRENIFRNNILAFSQIDQIQRTRDEQHLSFTFARNIVYYNQGNLLGSNWNSPEHYRMESNLYWRADGKPVTFPGNRTLEQWQQTGQDKGSLIADPLFVAPEKGDFTLKPGSPAGKIGFAPIAIDKAGRLTRGTPLTPAPPAFPVKARE